MKEYDPASVTVSLFGFPVTGFQKGTFVKVEYEEETFKKTVGSDGEVARVRNRNSSGRITVTLMQTSSSNDKLAAVHAKDKLDGSGVGPAQVADVKGTTLVNALNAWIVKSADIEYADETTAREWMIDVDNLDAFVGGAIG